MGVWTSYRMYLNRKRRLLRAARKSFELSPVVDRTGQIEAGDILLFSVIRNEKIRLPYFLRYYRDLGVSHFLIVDNGSEDGSLEYLRSQADISLWETQASYKKANAGIDWINWLARRYAHEHWALTVDPDEFLIYPFCDTRPLNALADWLDASGIRSFGAMLLDMYPKGAINRVQYREGQDPLEVACWFDGGNYIVERNHTFENLWIRGGPRLRLLFADQPKRAPALNKIPLVKWHQSYVYASSTHMLLPRKLNRVYDHTGGEKTCGLLLHMKFLPSIAEKTTEELERREHYASSVEYRAYHRLMKDRPELWCSASERYLNWRQLEALGLMSRGIWV